MLTYWFKWTANFATWILFDSQSQLSKASPLIQNLNEEAIIQQKTPKLYEMGTVVVFTIDCKFIYIDLIWYEYIMCQHKTTR